MRLDGNHIELTTPRARQFVVNRLAAELRGKHTAQSVMDILMSRDDVAEVFCDVDTLAQLLGAAK